jgi:hypothetical protein
MSSCSKPRCTQVSQLFLLPTLVLIAALFLYAFWVLGEFGMLAWRRRHGAGSAAGGGCTARRCRRG